MKVLLCINKFREALINYPGNDFVVNQQTKLLL